MFDRLQKPFLTVVTGEAYQPLRLTYSVVNQFHLIQTLDSLKCLVKNTSNTTWDWFWTAECEDLHFESLDNFKRNPEHPVRLGTIILKENKFYISLPSFKRACFAVPFFHKLINPEVAKIFNADFINKVFAIDERLPHGFTELFKDDELDRILNQRIHEYSLVQEQIENAGSVDEAFNTLKNYTSQEAKKRLPYAERYVFDFEAKVDTEIMFLSFYIFLRSRELVAINRWQGELGFTLADAAEDAVDKVFGGMDIDLIE